MMCGRIVFCGIAVCTVALASERMDGAQPNVVKSLPGYDGALDDVYAGLRLEGRTSSSLVVCCATLSCLALLILLGSVKARYEMLGRWRNLTSCCEKASRTSQQLASLFVR